MSQTGGSQQQQQEQIDLRIEGMSCGHCVAAVKQALESVPGTTVDDVRVGSARVTIPAGGAGGESAQSRLTDALDDAGYSAQVVSR